MSNGGGHCKHTVPGKMEVGQGGTLSASWYKLYIRSLLEKLSESTITITIGGALIGTPTCADDTVAYMAYRLIRTCKLWSTIITNVINTYLVTSVVHAVFKCAIVKPVLKKSTLDNDALHNYRPVSNLPFVSKLVERVAAKQLNAHLDHNALRDPFQSAYRAGHSTETALIRVKNGIAGALDRKCTTIQFNSIQFNFIHPKTHT